MNKKKIETEMDWNEIETVLLDMDGTLLDKHFDDYFWEEHVPTVYAQLHGMNFGDAYEELMGKYKSKEGTLEWTDINYWSKELGINIAEMKAKMNHLIQMHPYVIDFLKFCKENVKKIYLVTNAHSKTLAIKMANTDIEQYFDRIICSEEIGVAKEDPMFWEKLEKMLNFDRNKCILADDNELVLESAEKYGIKQLIFVAKSSSKKPVAYSKKFPSIIFFKELIATH
ncbi:MAG: HAD-IA family hydrolase [Proteobacteria bacterium]|nr:HAD-IA family hydrolase [Pseudomonadota bacterium]MBU4297895.1 HAD-IA family hydrolase [Pseudomonadota bacterium]MCG2746015.1 HAD-IA family hydrolase [Desulfobulbaceae bacterium]